MNTQARFTWDPYKEKGPFKVGDVVHADDASAILGDVTAVEDDGDSGSQDVTVVWRTTETTEDGDDLWLVERRGA